MLMVTNTKKYDKTLTNELKQRENKVLEIYRKLRENERHSEKITMASLHSTIGSHNSDFANCKYLSFANFEQYLAQWYKGLNEKYGDRIVDGINGKCGYIIFEMLKYQICREYIELFLERTFYRDIEKMRREKPAENLWEIWFGANDNYWGILLTPTYRNNKWVNDISEIRGVKYQYWTIGHILSTGIINPKLNKLIRFKDVNEIIEFYRNILYRCSNSKYEKAVIELYCSYLEEQSDPNVVPLLIPEFRYGNEAINHRYRLDFTILNSYTNRYIGFEISPQSTHMRVSGKDKTLKEHNDDLKLKWGKESDKRNSFFEEYDIDILTFTDNRLTNIDGCFQEIKGYLGHENENVVSLDIERNRALAR